MEKIIAEFKNWLEAHGISHTQVEMNLSVLTESGTFRLAQEIARETVVALPVTAPEPADRISKYSVELYGMKINVTKQKAAPWPSKQRQLSNS